ncbi:glycoside hydrolase family 16 protein [Sphingomonas sp. Leaf343]|uniref:glycoside hydrolase family 16 protein n=1 Tax=Sphingomonas sp. Leaf343 TaxID=1736345 RepID=UPI000715A376|nr:glycoside hydrolase family 16 protein [Sphingomonas sp. Leaf343]KQR80217.1 hypothetical protein ASG07_15600 [Sphingomonas sp. Leaf343]
MQRPLRLLVAAGALPLACSGTDPQTLDPGLLGKKSYEQTFARDASPDRFGHVYKGLATWGYFGAEPEMRRTGRFGSQQQRATSRTWPGINDMYVDHSYCPGARTPLVRDGALHIVAYRFSAADRASCGQGRQWASAFVSSQPSFAQTFGYFEIDATIPCDPGRWPAFWLLPVKKTPENGGRLAEIDVFEHYGGAITLTSQGRPVEINRRGQPFATLHAGVTGNEQRWTNADKLPKLTEAERDAFCKAPHTYGVLWRPDEFRFYIDRRETLRTPNPGVTDPHYWVLNLDISPRAGNPDLKPEPSSYIIRSVRAWTLK